MAEKKQASQEEQIINSLLATFYPKAKAGDSDAADKIIKLLQLKRLYKQDRIAEDIQ